MNQIATRLVSRLGYAALGYHSVVLLAAAGVWFCADSLSVRAEPGISAAEPAAMDSRRLFALGMIESGNDDRGVGPGGEISRYQIQPSVWKSYTESRDYQEPEVAQSVARQHWNYLTNYFRDKTGREPTDFDMYVLWNTRFGYYASKGFDQHLLNEKVRDRARRFVNLVNR